MFSNIPQVTKNLLILNVLMFLGTYILHVKGIEISQLLSLHSFSSPLFKPFQLVSHFFMHDQRSIFHLLFNMFALVMFGSFLERLWGGKRFFILYVVSAFTAVLLYNGINEIQLMGLRDTLATQGIDYQVLDNAVLLGNFSELYNVPGTPEAFRYIEKIATPMVGASGAIFGIMAAFAILFPNTQLQLLFPPIPIKAKYLIGGYLLLELYLAIWVTEGDNVAHLAHIGGAIGGAIMVLIWRKDKTKFY